MLFCEVIFLEMQGTGVYNSDRNAYVLRCKFTKVDTTIKQRGFTLIELLVVIAIIALLMSILFPALKRVQQQAKDVMCRSNLKQWGVIYMLYAEDNEGYFSDYSFQSSAKWWTTVLQGYYENPDMFFCQMADKVGIDSEGKGTKFYAWNQGGYKGSYGQNGWLYNADPQAVKDAGTEIRHPEAYFWRYAYINGAGYIPMLLDCSVVSGWPLVTALPPDYDGQMVGDGDMVRFCQNRHNGHINGVFVDKSVQRIGLKSLWKLKWHRKWDISLTPTEEEFNQDAPWMKNFD